MKKGRARGCLLMGRIWAWPASGETNMQACLPACLPACPQMCWPTVGSLAQRIGRAATNQGSLAPSATVVLEGTHGDNSMPNVLADMHASQRLGCCTPHWFSPWPGSLHSIVFTGHCPFETKAPCYALQIFALKSGSAQLLSVESLPSALSTPPPPPSRRKDEDPEAVS